MFVRTCYSGSTRQICGNIIMAFFFKLSYSKVRAFFIHLGKARAKGHLQLMSTSRAMFRILSVTCL